jgi:hypothetical protein
MRKVSGPGEQNHRADGYARDKKLGGRRFRHV